MTTPLHGVISFTTCYYATNNFMISVIAALLGMTPDLLRLFQQDVNDWNDLYRKSHKISLLNLLIPFWNLHILMDYYIHEKETGKWKDVAYILEVCLWMIMTLYWYSYFNSI